MLEFEQMLAEKMEEKALERKCSLDSSRKLVPRSTQFEQHALLKKKDSGISEIEELLKEKESEFLRRMKEKSESDVTDASGNPNSKRFWLHRGSLGVLEPRLSQYTPHALLQSKDDDGRSPLQMFLEEKEEEQERKVSTHPCSSLVQVGT